MECAIRDVMDSTSNEGIAFFRFFVGMSRSIRTLGFDD